MSGLAKGNKWIFDPSNDDRIPYPNVKLDPKNVRWVVPNGFSTPGNTPATSQWSLPRGCPKCGGHLILFDFFQQYQLVLVQCKTCYNVYHEPDLENDDIYRLVPESERLAMFDTINRTRQLNTPGG